MLMPINPPKDLIEIKHTNSSNIVQARFSYQNLVSSDLLIKCKIC
ncbi:hypothetical protein GPSY_3520 [Paraglaciecola psychrophila 170]|nr:hypothetical protein GPSY_3520 [Paraglaciecola psychrophila 170]